MKKIAKLIKKCQLDWATVHASVLVALLKHCFLTLAQSKVLTFVFIAKSLISSNENAISLNRTWTKAKLKRTRAALMIMRRNLPLLLTNSESRSVVSDSLRPHGLYSPWNSPGQNTGVGSLSLFQGIFPTQRLNPGLLHCRWVLY